MQRDGLGVRDACMHACMHGAQGRGSSCDARVCYSLHLRATYVAEVGFPGSLLASYSHATAMP